MTFVLIASHVLVTVPAQGHAAGASCDVATMPFAARFSPFWNSAHQRAVPMTRVTVTFAPVELGLKDRFFPPALRRMEPPFFVRLSAIERTPPAVPVRS